MSHQSARAQVNPGDAKATAPAMARLLPVVLLGVTLFVSLTGCVSAPGTAGNGKALAVWRQAVQQADSGKAPLSVVCLGDSNTEIFGYAGSLRLLLQSCYGSAGNGYYTLGKRMEEIPGAPRIERRGNWEYFDVALDPKEPLPPPPWLAIDGLWSATGDATAELKVSGGAGRFTLYVQSGPGLGSFDLVPAGSAKGTTVDTAAPAPGILSETVAAREFTVRNVRGRIVLLGVEARNPQAAGGAVLHQIGNGWGMAHHYAAIEQQAYERFFAATQPALITVLLGTNDMCNGWNAAAYSTKLNAVVGKLKAAAPASSILVISAPSCTFDRKFQAPAFATAARQVAQDNGCAFLDLSSIVGDDWQCWDQLGVMEYTLHYLPGSGMSVAREILRAVGFDWQDQRHQPLLRQPAALLAPGVQPSRRSPPLP